MEGKTIDYLFAVFIGIFIGCLHGIVMWATMNTGATLISNGTSQFIPASYYNNVGFYQMAIGVAAIIDIISLTIVLTSGIWLPKAMHVMEKLAEEYEESKRENGDEE